MVIQKRPVYISAVYIALLIIIIVFVMVMAKRLLLPLLLSGYIAMLLTPFCNRLEKNKIPASLSAFAALALFLLALVGLVLFIISQIGNLMVDLESNIMNDLESFAAKANTAVIDYTGVNMGMGNGLDSEKIMAIIQNGKTTSGELILMTLGTVSTILLFPVFIFFLLIYRNHLAIFVTKVFERQRNKILMEHIIAIRQTVHAYILGAGKVMLILGVVNTLILFFLGIKHAIFFGMLAGFLNIIPYLGPALGAILPFLFALITKDSLFYPIAVVISFTAVQFLESAFLTPKITGSNVNLNAFITFLALLIGAAIWGIAGMLVIIPTIAILKKLFELSPMTEPYAYLFGEEDSRWFKRHKF